MFEKLRWERACLPQRIIIPVASFLVLFGLYRANYLLFYSVVEMMCVVVAGAIFLLTWKSGHNVQYTYIPILGAGYLAVAILDLLHFFGHPGMAVMPNLHADGGMQLRVAARFAESATLLCVSLFVARKIPSNLLPAVSVGIAVFFATAIVVWRIFPTLHIPGQGVTFFKIGSECFILFILLVSVYRLRRNRQIFEQDVWLLLVSALWATIFSETAFIFNGEAEGLITAVGLILKLASIFLIYLSIVATASLPPHMLAADDVALNKAAAKETQRPGQKRLNRTVFDGEAEFKLAQAGQSLEQRVETHTKALSTAVGHSKAQIGEKSKIGAELKERNLMLKALVQAIPDMVSYKDSQGRYLIANSVYKDFFGLKGTSLIGRRDEDIPAILAAKWDPEKERLVMEKGKASRFERVLCSASGCTSHWDIRIVPVNGGDGKLTGVLTLAREISPFKRREFELQQSKALLQAFLNGISDPMLMIDNDLRPVYLNRAASKAYSTTIQGQGGSICGPVLCDRKGQCEVCKVKTHLKRKKPVSFERRTAGSDRVEKIYLYPLSGKKDGLDGAVVRVADITEAKGLERHLIHSEKMNALGMLVAGMVHEINNPNSFITFNLPILRAYLEKIFLLLDSHPAAVADKDWFGMDYPAFRREIFNLTDNLSHGSSRIDNIISNLKSMTHPKEVSNRRKWVELFEVVDKAVMLCRNEVRKRVKVFEVKPPRPAIQLKTDPEALEQVIINLLINASHAADKRESWVRIEALLSKDKPNHAV
ncbi:MAG: MASE3 domain-containing protein, partial [Desulfobacteraceae bacterium]